MSFPSSHVGSYTGTGAAISITDIGFKPNFVRIWNDTDNDVIFDFYANQSAGLASKMSSGGVFTGGALSGGTITASFTGGALSGGTITAAFAGDDPKSAETSNVVYEAVPGGNQIYVKFQNNGEPYLCCNMATAAADALVSFSGSAKFLVRHDASASVGGLALYMDDDASPASDRLLVDNTLWSADCFLRSVEGSLLKLKHDASAATNGVELNFDDGTDMRLEAAFPGLANANMSTLVESWKVAAPSGAVTGSADGTCAGSVSGTCAGTCTGSVTGMVSEVSSGAITLTVQGFNIGTDSSINESGKTYRYIAIR